jgi:hypothetical protein
VSRMSKIILNEGGREVCKQQIKTISNLSKITIKWFTEYYSLNRIKITFIVPIWKNSHLSKKLDPIPDPHSSERLDADPYEMNADPNHW